MESAIESAYSDNVVNRCLRVDEILRKIAAWLNAICNPKSYDVNWRSLRNMALTCQALYEPAVDELWGGGGSLRHLVYCLLGNTAQGSGAPERDRTAVIRRPLLPAEWGRFQHYARRIKYLHMNEVGRDDSNWWECLQSCPVGAAGVIFPRLEVLSITVNRNMSALWPLLITPKLRHLQLKSLDLNVMAAAFRFICKQSTSLEALDVILTPGLLSNNEVRPSKSHKILTDVVCAQERLKDLRSNLPPRLSQDALVHLSHLHSLASFTIEITPENFPTSVSSPLGPFSLSLRHVTVKVASEAIDVGISFLSTLPHTLVSLEVILTSPREIDSISLLAQAVSSFFCQDLQCLTITQEVESSWAPMLTIPGDAVSCLGSLHNLRSIKLENLGVLYDSDTVRHLAESWPALMSLAITHPGIIRICPCMELEDVLHFVENCFNLASIAITINPIKDDSSFPPESSLPLSVASWVHFHGFECSGNIIDKVAQFIAAIFVHSEFRLHDNPSCEWAANGYREHVIFQLGAHQEKKLARQVGVVAGRFAELRQDIPYHNEYWWMHAPVPA